MYVYTHKHVGYCVILWHSCCIPKRGALGLQRQVYPLLVLFRAIYCLLQSGVSVPCPCPRRGAEQERTEKSGDRALSFC